jgi:hypothetical protein
MNKVDFVEIGTSNFNTLIENSVNESGFSIEPIQEYLDDLPDKLNVTKINCAITNERDSSSIELYYIPKSVIESNGLDPWLKGCNTIGDYHPHHIDHPHKPGVSLKEYVKIKKVPLKTVKEFLDENKIEGIKYLKIDTEGHDIPIVNGFFDSMQNLPDKIRFEYKHSKKEDIDNIIQRSNSLGYSFVVEFPDIILTKK